MNMHSIIELHHGFRMKSLENTQDNKVFQLGLEFKFISAEFGLLCFLIVVCCCVCIYMYECCKVHNSL